MSILQDYNLLKAKAKYLCVWKVQFDLHIKTFNYCKDGPDVSTFAFEKFICCIKVSLKVIAHWVNLRQVK